jgi:hypothetical protein
MFRSQSFPELSLLKFKRQGMTLHIHMLKTMAHRASVKKTIATKEAVGACSQQQRSQQE